MINSNNDNRKKRATWVEKKTNDMMLDFKRVTSWDNLSQHPKWMGCWAHLKLNTTPYIKRYTGASKQVHHG